MNCWSIKTSKFDVEGLHNAEVYDVEEDIVDSPLFAKPVSHKIYTPKTFVVCELKRNDQLMIRRVVPLDIVAEVIPAMQMAAQGLAMLEVNPRLKPIDLESERDNTLLTAIEDKFGVAPSVDFVINTVDKILERAKDRQVKDQHPDLGEGQKTKNQLGLEADFDTTDQLEEDAGTDPHITGVEPRGGKTCGSD